MEACKFEIQKNFFFENRPQIVELVVDGRRRTGCYHKKSVSLSLYTENGENLTHKSYKHLLNE